jgi:methyl-accepting chemotaxis protein
MFSKMIRKIKEKMSFLIGIILIVMVLFVIFSGYLFWNRTLNSIILMDRSALPSFSFLLGKYMIMVCILSGGIIIVGLLWFLRNSTIRPSRALLRVGQNISTKDYSVLTAALTELAQGNLCKQLNIQPKLLKPSISSRFNKIINIFNSIAETLQETVREFNNLTNIPCLRLCYVGGNSYVEGRRCGEVMGDFIGAKGQIAIISSSSLSSILRCKGFESAINENYPEVQIVGIQKIRQKSDVAYSHTKTILKKYSNIKGIYVTQGSTPQYVAKAVIEANKVGRIKIVGHDLVNETMYYLKQGVITATVAGDVFARGHDSVIHLFNHLVSGWEPASPHFFTHIEIVTIDNYRQFWDEKRGIIQSGDEIKRLVKPVDKPSPKPLRIAVLGKEDTAYWIPIHNGVMAASDKLSSYNVTVNWIIPENHNGKEKINQTDIYGPAFESLIEDGYDAIATLVFDQNMVQYINRAAKERIPVVTYDSEPTSLRGLVFTFSKQVQKLMGLSENLDGSVFQVNQSIRQINSAIKDMSEGVVYQNKQVNRTRNTLEALLENINSLNMESKKSSEASANTTKAVITGSGAMEYSLKSMRSIEKSVSETWNIVEKLAKHSEKIDSIIEMIDDIASRVNVLGLNASIEATRSGRYGKGFMVVANEIRELARNTAKATKEVTDVINTIQSDIGKIEKVMVDGLGKVKESVGLTDEAITALSGIRKFVEADQKRIKKIARAMNDMQQFSQEVGEAMDKVAIISDRSAASVEDVNKSTGEMGSQLEAVAALAESLEFMAKGERQLLARFEI